MGEWVKLTAADGQELQAYVAKPAGNAIGGLVLVQEIFGVNSHIRSVCDRYASEGFLVVAPAIFDRFESGVQLDYTPEARSKALGFIGKLKPETTLTDLAAAFKYAAEHSGKKVGVVGFCYGGQASWLAATRGEQYGMEPAACVGYYAGGIGALAAEEPSCPVMLHFGAADSHIGSDQIDAVRDAHPEVEIFVYEGAKHAFNRDVDPASYDPAAAKLAGERTVAFLTDNLR